MSTTFGMKINVLLDLPLKICEPHVIIVRTRYPLLVEMATNKNGL